jgi:hypothetical protein
MTTEPSKASIEAYWAEAGRLGILSGHVVCRCPDCDERCLVSYRPPSQPWPRCRVCLPPSIEIPVRWGQPRQVARAPAARVVPVSDPAAVAHKRPGQPRTARALKADGCVVVRSAASVPPGGPETPPGGFPEGSGPPAGSTGLGRITRRIIKTNGPP